MIPDTTARVARSTAASISQQVESDIRQSVLRHVSCPERIDERLQGLPQEWDAARGRGQRRHVRTQRRNPGRGVDGRWPAVPAVVTSFLLQRAVQGCCPPLPILRHLHFRAAREIETERTALKAPQGDLLGRPSGRWGYG